MAVNCRGCQKAFPPDQLDGDGTNDYERGDYTGDTTGGFCFDCCNKREEQPSMRGALREFLTGLVGRLAEKRKVSPQVVKAKLVGEYYENLAERRREPAWSESDRGRVLN